MRTVMLVWSGVEVPSGMLATTKTGLRPLGGEIDSRSCI